MFGSVNAFFIIGCIRVPNLTLTRGNVASLSFTSTDSYDNIESFEIQEGYGEIRFNVVNATTLERSKKLWVFPENDTTTTLCLNVSLYENINFNIPDNRSLDVLPVMYMLFVFSLISCWFLKTIEWIEQYVKNRMKNKKYAKNRMKNKKYIKNRMKNKKYAKNRMKNKKS